MADIWTVLFVTLLAGAATGLGAIPILARDRITHRTYDAALGLAAGIMLGATIFGLIIPGLEEGSLTSVLGGVFLGGFVLLGFNRVLPHVHARYRGFESHGDATSEPDTTIRRALLIGGAITLHNGPEGLAIGVAFAAGLEEVALFLALVIGLQNIPDGFAFAVPVSDTGLRPRAVFVATTLSGVGPQVGAAVFGFGLVRIASEIFPLAAGFAAGAMLAVIFREMIPASHGHGHADAATAAFLVGVSILVLVEAVAPI